MLRGSSDPNGQRQAALSPLTANLDKIYSQASRKISRAVAKVPSKRDMVKSATPPHGNLLAWSLPDVGTVFSYLPALLMITWLLQADANSVQALDKLVNDYKANFAALSIKAQGCVAGSYEVEVNLVVHLSLTRTVPKSWPDELLFQPLSFSRPECTCAVFLLSPTMYESFRFGLRSWMQQMASSQRPKRKTTLKGSLGLRWRTSSWPSRAERYEWCLVIAFQHMLALLL